MKKSQNETKTIIEESTAMKKYIVEAPEPKEGQSLSSGGIRQQNGKMATQFKNPILYEEFNVEYTYPYGYKDLFIDELKYAGIECAKSFLYEVGVPVLKKSFYKFGQKILKSMDSSTNPLPENPTNKIQSTKISKRDFISATENEKVISFPTKRIG